MMPKVHLTIRDKFQLGSAMFGISFDYRTVLCVLLRHGRLGRAY